ncbi:double-stranded RNA-binding protein 2-like isoform X1 [Salvia divinorum]|uniref:Double-stranded RNA-binding protein 2-like isoform X1 n=1 Tax=Salvia divinorum TaxID=28513 RepID=A0ABD1FK15_SALDI
MYKNQLQELAQRSCFNLPAYTSIREGPDHAPRFKAVVNFNGESFESPSYCSTLRQAEHSAAEVALNALAGRGPSNSLAARILDETGVYKNLLQEVSQRVGASLPAYSTFRTGLGHLPIFTCTVELAGVIFTGMPAKNKKQAEKNAAMAAWLSLKSLVQQTELTYEKSHKDEQEHVTVARALQKYLIKARLARSSFPIKFPTLNLRPSSTQLSPITTSKILPLICPKTAQRNRPSPALNNNPTFQMNVRPTSQPMVTVPNESQSLLADIFKPRPQKFPAAGAAPYIPVRLCNPHSRIAPPVTIRNTIPVFSAPPLPSPQSSLSMRPPTLHMAPPVSIRQAVPVFAAPVRMDEMSSMVHPSVKVEDPRIPRPVTPQVEEPLFSKALQGTLDDSPFSKLPSFLVEYPFGYTKPAPVAPASEALTVQGDLPTTEALPVKLKHPVPPVEETTAAEQDKQQKPAEVEIEGLEGLKI